MENYPTMFPISSAPHLSLTNMAMNSHHHNYSDFHDQVLKRSNGFAGMQSSIDGTTTTTGGAAEINSNSSSQIINDGVNYNSQTHQNSTKRNPFRVGSSEISTIDSEAMKSSSGGGGGGGGGGGVKKKGEKKVRKPRYAFQTRSQVDILDDGYRWRKYGQKAVKNNKFPRSYYRCTYQGCNVKKQVQRLSKDEGVVVTTYEGMHSHPIERSTDNFEHILSQMQIYTSF